MTRCIIFDLSEVLIAGLVGVERELTQELPLPEETILPCFGGDPLRELLMGRTSEDVYLRRIIVRERWRIDAARLKAAIRRNFHNEITGSIPLLMDLAPRHQVVLHSDHAREWIAYIEAIHPFLRVVEQAFFSYDLGKTKDDPESFLEVLEAISVPPQDCLFIDDNPTNIGAAASVGIPGIRFVSVTQLASELERRGLR